MTDQIEHLSGSEALEAAYTLVARDIGEPGHAYALLAARFGEDAVEQAQTMAAELAASQADLDAFARLLLAAALADGAQREQAEISIASAGERAFFEGGEILQHLWIFGALYLANLKVSFSHVKSKSEKSGERSTIKFSIEPRAKVADFLALFKLGRED